MILVLFSDRSKKTIIAVFGLTLLVAFGAVVHLLTRLSQADEELDTQLAAVQRRLQQLDAGITFDSRRHRMLLGIRDEIMRVNPRIGLHDAFEYAENVLRASDKYPTVSPLLLLAIGTVESGFRSEAVSSANARGLYQISPSTGRVLARALGWEYTDEMLFDPEKNTEMAALYLDILDATYDDRSLVLAEYNGGPRNAGLLRAGSADVAPETRDYVKKVLTVYEQFDSGLKNGGAARASRLPLSIYRSRDREGKTLTAAALPYGQASSENGQGMDD